MNILKEANKAVSSRHSSYDHPKNNFKRIADLWNGYLEAKGSDLRLDGKDVSMFMMLVKMAREMYAHKSDNQVDIAGYAQCLEDLYD